MSRYRVRWYEEHAVTIEAEDAERAKVAALFVGPESAGPTFQNKGMYIATEVPDDAPLTLTIPTERT